MARPKAKAPARRYHMSGQSVTTIDGKDYYLGPHDSPESIARYAVLIGVYQSGGLKLPKDFSLADLDARAGVLLGTVDVPQRQADEPVLVRHVTALFREHMREKYQSAPVEQIRHERLCGQLDEHYGNVLAVEFGPVRLKAFRDWLITDGSKGPKKLSRKYVNRLVNCVVAMFRHAVAGEIVDVAVVLRLETLEPLRYGQTTAPEVAAVQPANLEHVRQTAKHLSATLKSMLRIQIATGMRPAELCIMRPCDIDRSGAVWLYAPSKHKTSYRGKSKLIPIVGDAREAVTDYLNRDAQSFCFAPAEAVRARRAIATASRKTPLSCGNKPGTNRKESPQRTPGERYTTASYSRAIKRAAEKAGVPHWFPYQLRHLTATVIRAALGLEPAKALIGHSTALMTAHYARESVEAATLAAEAAPKL